jgi:hypothetical protein
MLSCRKMSTPRTPPSAAIESLAIRSAAFAYDGCLSFWSLPNVVADIVRLGAVTGFPQEYRFT